MLKISLEKILILITTIVILNPPERLFDDMDKNTSFTGLSPVPNQILILIIKMDYFLDLLSANHNFSFSLKYYL